MAEAFVDRVHSEHVVLDIGQDIGALVIYTKPELYGRQIDVSPSGSMDSRRTHTDVLERRINGRPIFAAVFAELKAGCYRIWCDPQQEVTILGGRVNEIDWRSRDVYVPPVGGLINVMDVVPDFLPPRHQGNSVVSAAPMGSAPFVYSDNGDVAWDQMWASFCDLALAGGPPHRGTLLEPVMPAEIEADMEAYKRVVTEIERGLYLVTGLPVIVSEKLGWVGLHCVNEEMALWLLRAIIVENVCIRREGAVLFLPAGPAFELEREIKNVITVVAKTYHYWSEHMQTARNSRQKIIKI